MSETTNAPTTAAPVVELPKIDPLPIERNGVTFVFEPQAETKGKQTSEGPRVFLAPLKMDELSLADLIKYVNNDKYIVKAIVTKVKKVWKQLYDDNLVDGVINLAQFTSAVQSEKFFSESIKVLRSQLDELLAQITSPELNNGSPDNLSKIQGLIAQIAVLRKAIDAKSRVKDDDDEEGDNDGDEASSQQKVA